MFCLTKYIFKRINRVKTKQKTKQLELMKHILIFTILCMSMLVQNVSAQNRDQFIDISDDEVASAALTPSEVYQLPGRKRQTKPTWALVETNSEPSGSIGILREIRRGKDVTTYTVGGVDTVALPNNRFRMAKDSILYASRGGARWHKLEAIILEMKTCLCTPKTGLAFSRDSVTQNTYPDAYKMVLWVENFKWLYWENMLVPALSAHLVDTIDQRADAAYAISVSTENGANCGLLWLHREDLPGPVKETVYTVSTREGKRFAFTEDSGYTFDGEKIKALIVLRPYVPKSNGKSQKRRHDKRARKR